MTAKAATLTVDGGPLSFAINMEASNRVKSVADALAQAKVYRNLVTLESRYDLSAGKDFLLSFGT